MPVEQRHVLVVQADPYNKSKLATVLVAVVAHNTALATMPGNVFLPAKATGLPQDGVVNVAVLITFYRDELKDVVGRVPGNLMRKVDQGLRRVLAL